MSTTILGRAAAFLKRRSRAVRKARRGNMAIIFALAIVPVLITGGAGIDLARSLAVRAKLYEAVDAAALAVASKPGMTQAQAQTLAQQYFNANYTLNSSFGTPVLNPVTINGQQVDLSSNIAMPTTLMGIAGIQNVNLSASSRVVWGQTKIWVGLALDNTGSMCEPTGSQPCTNPANSKIAALKTATHSLLTMFQNASAVAGDVQVSLIPFSRDVNFGASNSGSASLDWTEWDSSHPGLCYVNGVLNGNYTTEAGCSGAGTCAINGQSSSQTSQSACTSASAGTCTVNGVANSNFATQSACNSAGTCTISGNYSQNSCQNATTGTCSISGYTSQWSCQNATTGTCSIAGNNSQNSCQSAYVWACSLSGYNNQSSCQTAGTCSISGKASQSSCTTAATYACSISGYNDQTSCTTNGVCSKTNRTTQNSCINHSGVWTWGVWQPTYGVWTPGTWGKVYGVWTTTNGVWTTTNGVWTSSPGTWTVSYGVWTPATTTSFTPNRLGWTGCIMDRGTVAGPSSSTSNTGYDIVNTTPGSAPESRFPTENYSQCPVQMMGLSYDWTALNNKVDAMVAQGNTNQPIGVAWAWQSMTQGNPLNPPSLPNGTTRHIIVLSDGANTGNRWNMNESGIDDRMHLLCNNAKNDGVIVWAVFVNIAGTAGNAASMQDCATGGANGGHYIEVTSTGGIGSAFDVIGQQITNLRVAH